MGSHNAACIYVANQSSGTSTSFCALGTAQDYNGQSAEWIVERTDINKQFPHLANFGSVNFSQAYAATASLSQPLSYWSNTAIDLVDDSKPLVDSANLDGDNNFLSASGGLTSSTTFTDYWYAYGDIDDAE